MSRSNRTGLVPATALAALLVGLAPATLVTAPDGALSLSAATALADDRDDGRISYGDDDDRRADRDDDDDDHDRWDRDDDDDDDRRAGRDDDDDDRRDRDDDDDDDD